MRVLLVFHGWLPREDRPASGGALRAWAHGRALQDAGHEVLYLTRDQDAVPGGPPVFGSPGELRRLAGELAPDRILCVQPEEAPNLAGLGVPLCVDFYAPRLLEAAWQEAVDAEAVHTLRALAAADFHLFSNPRQRWFYLGLLALAGVDPRATSGAVVPLVAPRGPRRRRPPQPRLVMGGVAWPWQDPTGALRRTVDLLAERGRGQVVVCGGPPALGDAPHVDLPALVPPGPHLRYAGILPWGALLATYAGSTAALDLMSPNPEREIALAFRQVEYLGCGLPPITGPGHVLAPQIAEHQAGWVVEGELEPVLAEVLDHPEEVARRGRNARRLARERFDLAACEAPLLRWVEQGSIREKGQPAMPRAAELSAALASAEAERGGAEALKAAAELELAGKREEVVALAAQVRSLTSTVERLARAVDEVAGFKREAIRVLGKGLSEASGEAGEMARQLSELRVDLQKKVSEMGLLERERDRLATDLETAQAGALSLEERLAELGSREAVARAELGRLRAELDATRAERDRLAAEREGMAARVEALSGDLQKKIQEVAEANGELHRVHDRAGRFEAEAERLGNQVEALRAENERLSRRRFLR